MDDMQHIHSGQNQQDLPASQVDAAWEDMLRKLERVLCVSEEELFGIDLDERENVSTNNS